MPLQIWRLQLDWWTLSWVGRERTFGLGWWRGSHKLWQWQYDYCNGFYWSFRCGPLFVCRGPYDWRD